MNFPQILSRSIACCLRIPSKRAASAVALSVCLSAAGYSPSAEAANIDWNTSQAWDSGVTQAADTVRIGITAGSRAVVILSTDDEITNLNGVGGGGTGAGAVFQISGNLVLSEGINDTNFSLGGVGINASAGYGYYNILDGSLQGAKLSAGGRAIGAIGVFDISGGSVIATEKLAIARGSGASSTTEAASYGLINVTGGNVVTNTVTTAIPSVEMGYNTNSYAVFNVGGGPGAATVTGVSSSTGGGLDLGNQFNAGTGIANLLTGGTLTVSRVYTVSTGTVGTQLLNFNGGTLKATATNFGANFLSDADIDAVTVYSGGGTIDNSDTHLTIARPLLGASGFGVTTIPVTDGGAGYVGAPFVHLSGGTGSGATAVANMIADPANPGFFKIGSITITSPGSYTDTTGLVVALRGGGALTGATLGTATTAANIGGGMAYTGTGITTLAGANTYTGATTINGATLVLSSTGSIANSSGVLLNTGTFIGRGSVNNVTVANSAANILSNVNGAVLTTGSLTFNGGATLNLNYGGVPSIAVSGALTTTGANGPVTINGTAPSWVGGINNLVSFGNFNGAIGDFMLGTFTGLSGRQIANSLVVNGNNIAVNITGDNVLWTGAGDGVWLQYAQGSPTSGTPVWKLQASGTPADFWMADNAVFDDTAEGTTTATIRGGGITANTLTFNNSSKDYTIASDDGSGIAAGLLVKNGTKKLTLLTNNSYAGGTTLNAGTLVLDSVSAIGFGSLTINGGVIDSTIGTTMSANNAQNWNADFTFNGTTNLDMGSGDVAIGGVGDRTVTVAAGTLTVGEVKTTGSQGFTKQGPGTLMLTSIGDAAAGSVINGTLNVAAGSLQINRTGAFDGASSGDLVVGGLTGTGTITNGANIERLLIVNNASANSFGGTLANGGSGPLGLSKRGAGALTIPSTNYTYTGQTIFEGGVLNVASLADYGLPSSIGARSAAQEVATNIGMLFRGGTLQYTGSAPQSTNRQIRISTVGGGTIDASGSNPNATLSFTHTGPNADLFENPGARALTLTGSNTGENTFGIVLQNQDVNATSLIKTGTGKWVLTGASTYTGTTTVRAGTLTLAGNRTAASGGITVGDAAGLNATLNITNGNFNTGGTVFILSSQTNSSTVNHTGGTVTMGGTQLIVGNNAAGATGTYNLSGGTLAGEASTTRGVILGTNASTTGVFNLSGSGNLAMGSAALQVGRSDDGGSINSTGIFNQTGGTAAIGTLTIGGGTGGNNNAGATGTLNLTGGTFSAVNFALLAAANNSTANITIGGTAQVTLPAFPTARGAGATANLTFDGGTLSPVTTSPSYLGGLSSASITSNGAKFDVGSGNLISVSQAFQNATGQTGTLTKEGAGILALSGANTYTGATTVNAGTLLVTGSLTGSATVNGGVFGGTGAVGAVVVNDAGGIAPGAGIGTLVTGGLTLTDTAEFQLEINIAGANLVSTDLLSATNLSFDLDHSAVLTLSDLGSGAVLNFGTAITFIDYTGTWNGGTFAGHADDSTFTFGANQFRISYNGVNDNDTAVVLVAVPEPGSATLLLAGLGSMMGLRRVRPRSA